MLPVCFLDIWSPKGVIILKCMCTWTGFEHSLPLRQGRDYSPLLRGNTILWLKPLTLSLAQVAEDHPHLFPLSPHKSSSGGQGFAFLRNKSAMNVREIEFARAYRCWIVNIYVLCPNVPSHFSTLRLTETVIECVSFTVPRVKSTHFQVWWWWSRLTTKKCI